MAGKNATGLKTMFFSTANSYGAVISQEEALNKVRTYMKEISAHSFSGTEVGKVLDDALSAEGKMIRPRLLLLCGAIGPQWSEKYDTLCKLAAMIELTHMASLIHDDIIDEAPYRRGKPSIQHKYSKDAAVYAGDYLMASINFFQAKERLNDSGMIYNNAVQQMCIGEVGQALCRYSDHVTMHDYLQNIQGKTTALFKAACLIGATESGCNTKITQKLESFGEYLGIMFQLRDDLLDFTSSTKAEGKETHKDFQDGIYTLPVLMALKQKDCRRELEPLMQINKERRLTDEEIQRMEEIVVRYGGVEATKAEIKNLQVKSNQILNELPDVASVILMRKLLKALEI